MAKFDMQAFMDAPAQMQEIQRKQYATACEVHAQILNSAKAAQENLYQMAMGFKRMRDEKLYLQLGCQNFGDYCEMETSISRQNVYQYIKIVEKLPKDFVLSTRQTGKEKLYLLTSLSEEERTEVTENVDLESTTVKELKAEIAKLKEDKQVEISALESEQQALQAENKGLKMKNDELSAVVDENQDYKDRIIDLEKEIKELESRPIDVPVSDNSEEIDKLKSAYDLKINNREQRIYELKCEIEQLQDKLDEQSAQPTQAEETSNNSVSAVYVTYLAAMESAKEALNKLTVACIDYGDYVTAKALAQKFISDIEKVQSGEK